MLTNVTRVYPKSFFAAVAAIVVACDAIAATEISFGPMLGQVTESSIVVWARTTRPGTFTVRYGPQPAELTGRSAVVTTTLARDLTGTVRIEGLKPNTRYHLEVLGDGQSQGPRGDFRTLPAAAHFRDEKLNPRGLFNFRFELGCCQTQNPAGGIGPSLPTFATMLRERVPEKVHFSIINGDWLYEDMRTYSPESWAQQVGAGAGEVPRIVDVVPTITGMWENYKLYLRRGANLADWHKRVPTVFTFDDHELVNDIRGAGTTGFKERRAVFRDIAVQAWFDYLGWANPVEHPQSIHFGRAELKRGSDVLYDAEANFSRINFKQAGNLHVHWAKPTAGEDILALDSERPGNPNAGVYAVREYIDAQHVRIEPAAVADSVGSYSIGRRSYGKFRVGNCEYFLLDTKSHREMHDPANPMKPGLSMLGAEQKEWLLRSMRESDADFFFLASSVNFTIPHDGAGGHEMAAGKDEAWTALLHEREELIAAWEKLRKPVFVLTADLHNSFVVKVSDMIWEICSSPHNSVNHTLNDEGRRPITGLFKSGPRQVDIRWSSFMLNDIPRTQRHYPYYCIVQVNNVANNPLQLGGERWVAYPQPQVVFQFFNGRTGELEYAESVVTAR
ncbi:MAG: metallophosphoesterase family protein [Verrucomicrobiota bacterium]